MNYKDFDYNDQFNDLKKTTGLKARLRETDRQTVI